MRNAKKKPWRSKLQRRLLRPLIYAAFVRLVLGLFVGLLADFFLRESAGRDLRSDAFLVLALLFALMAVIAWLRLDGVRLPKPMMLRINPRKKPTRTYGDIADHLDETPMVDYDDLDDEEKDICLLSADLFCFAAFLAAAAIVA